jgi:hypothetical protein
MLIKKLFLLNLIGIGIVWCKKVMFLCLVFSLKSHFDSAQGYFAFMIWTNPCANIHDVA